MVTVHVCASSQRAHRRAPARAAPTRCPHALTRLRCLARGSAPPQEVVKEREPPPPNLDFGLNPEEEEMFFQEPQQLLAVYKQLEESNLFYIQNAQETEEALEELRGKYRDTKAGMDGEVGGLQAQIGALQGAIGAAREKSSRLKARTMENMGGLTLSMGKAGAEGGAPAVSLDQLGSKVAGVYVKCGFDADASVSTLQMLTNIEMKLEEYLLAAAGIPEEYIEGMEKMREKERRKVRAPLGA